MAALTTQRLVNAGTAPTFGAAAAEDTAHVGSGGDTFVVYRNSDSNPKKIVIPVPGKTSYGVDTPDPEWDLADGSGTPTEVWIPLRKEYIDRSVAGAGRCTLTVTEGGVTGLEVAVIQVG